jgi:methyltransferase OMS1
MLATSKIKPSMLHKIGVVLAGGGVYAVTAYFSYAAFASPPPVEATGTGTTHGDTGGCSCVHSSCRTQQFDKVAACYDNAIGRDEFFMGINLLRRSLLYWHARGTCLEMAAGTARNLAYYPSHVKRVVLTDQSTAMVQQARTKTAGTARFVVVQGDSTHLDNLPNHAFDTVVDTFGLCSYNDPVAVLREMIRLCKPGGKILLLEHGRSKSWQWVTAHLDKYSERHAALWGCVWNRDLDDMLDQVSDQLEVKVLHRWHFGTTYYVVCQPKPAGTT